MKLRYLIWLAIPVLLWGQNRGALKGRVINAETKEPLIGVNVMIKGTYYGAATGADGSYFITGINPGTYDVEASIIGFKVMLQTGIKIRPRQTTTLDFSLEETVLTLGEEVVVVGEKPLFDVDETSSMSRIRSDEIANKVVYSVEDILAEQIGVTKQDNEIHIRGGRVDESLYMIDGMSIKDPLSGYSGNLFVTAESIEELEIVTGGYNAEYGQAMSGVVNIRLKEGRDKYEGSLKYTSDNWRLPTDVITHYNTDRLEFSIGGPALMLEKLLPKLGLDLPGKFSFFSNGYGKIYDGNLPGASKLYPHRNWVPPKGISAAAADKFMQSLAQRENNDWHLLYKITWALSAKKKFGISYDASLNINQGYFMPRAFSSTYYPYRYEKILDNYNTITRESRLLNINWTHTLSTRSFYEIVFGRFITLEHSAVRDLPWSEYKERLDLKPINYIVTDRDGNIRITYGDEFYDTGFSPEWYDVSSDNYRIDADWTYHTRKRHKIKAGIENTLTEIQVIDIEEPWTGTTGMGANYDMYRTKTDFGAVFIQDRITFEGMTANLGIRYDYWFPGKYVEDAINDPNTIIVTDAAREKFKRETFELFGYRGKGRLSPRFGISHPVTDNDVLYFYYGHFSQLPTFQYVYAKLKSTSQSTYQVFGNPNLNPKTTVQYEIGIKHRFSEDQVLEMKAYWKDMFDYETSQTITPSNPKYSHLRFNMYFNADYARARGVEIIVKSRLIRNWYADLNFNYSIVTGKSSTPLDNLLVQAGELREKPLGENFMSWDKPYNFFSNIYYNHPSNWGWSLRFEFEAGRRYTRSIPGTNEYPDGIIEINGEKYYVGTREDDKPYFYLSDYNPKFFKMLGLKHVNGYNTIDLKLYKTIKLGRMKIKLLLEVENLFDERIPRRINPFTGRGYNPGEIIPYYLIERPNPNFDPSRVRRPRTTELGLQLIF
ncbi:MAG: TonB-dependent receptor [FCB group bacterium]|nr:TonB-dependent receptor [FCB group bacterium]